MPSYSALTTLPGEAAATALSEALERMDPAPSGVGTFEIEDGSGLWEVGAYFTEPPDATVLLLLATAFGAGPFVVSELPDIDWVAKVRRDLSPVRAGRFYLYGSHDAASVPPDVVPLQIEATVAFGTGHHGTTVGCLRALDRLESGGVRPARIADIGTGTGVLAMAAARLWPASVVASDIDAVAVDVAAANLSINGLEGRVALVEAAGFDHPRLAGPFDLIVANILKGPLIELAPAMAAHAAPDAWCILSGLLSVQADAVADAYAASGFRLSEREDIGEWATLIFRRI
ncbi:MAG: 50S ribosomal protein L11 methyltransferase [Gemmobacter sp.]